MIPSHGRMKSCMAPGIIDTDLTADVKDEIKQQLVNNVALGRIGTPEDVAKVIVLISSTYGDYVSGLRKTGCRSADT